VTEVTIYDTIYKRYSTDNNAECTIHVYTKEHNNTKGA